MRPQKSSPSAQCKALRQNLASKPSSTITQLKQGLALCCLLCFSQWAAADLPLLFTDSRINQPPPGASVAAGYLTIENHSDSDIKIVAASSEAFKKVEMHRSTIENDIAKMRKQDALDIKAGETLEMSHGGLHLMLMGITRPLEMGQRIPITLTTEDGSVFNVDFQVQRPGMKPKQTDSATQGEGHSQEQHQTNKPSKDDHANHDSN